MRAYATRRHREDHGSKTIFVFRAIVIRGADLEWRCSEGLSAMRASLLAVNIAYRSHRPPIVEERNSDINLEIAADNITNRIIVVIGVHTDVETSAIIVRDDSDFGPSIVPKQDAVSSYTP